MFRPGYKNILLLAGLLILLSGIVMAISGTSPGTFVQSRWNGNSAGSITAQGGNLTAVSISALALTTKWADFYGNLSGSIILGNGASNVYSWTYATSTVSRVCLTTNSSGWISSGVPSPATGLQIDTAWGFAPTDADSGSNTYSTNDCSLDISGSVVSGTGNVTLQGSSTFNDCVISNGAVGAGLTQNMAFCTDTNNAGRSYNDVPSNFEVMVPTNKTSVTSYYFYAELG
jgi:hypothetical protein